MKKLILISILFISCASHSVEVLSPSISVRSSNKENTPVDYQIAVTLLNIDNNYIWYEEKEREIGQEYVERQIKLQHGFSKHNIMFNDFFKTARDIHNTELGYLYHQKLFKSEVRVGSSIIWRHGVSYASTNTEFVYKDLYLRYALGESGNKIFESKFEKLKPFTDHIYGTALFKYYESEKQFFQIKFGIKFKWN